MVRPTMSMSTDEREWFHYTIENITKDRTKYNYWVPETAKGATGQDLLQLLEMRLDNILFRLGMALTIPGARQLVNHRHILVNGHIVIYQVIAANPEILLRWGINKNPELWFNMFFIHPPMRNCQNIWLFTHSNLKD